MTIRFSVARRKRHQDSSCWRDEASLDPAVEHDAGILGDTKPSGVHGGDEGAGYLILLYSNASFPCTMLSIGPFRGIHAA